VAWDYFAVLDNLQSASSYAPATGTRTLASSDFDSARTTLAAVKVSADGQCVTDVGGVSIVR
jgi:predicted N-acyltransferase